MPEARRATSGVVQQGQLPHPLVGLRPSRCLSFPTRASMAVWLSWGRAWEEDQTALLERAASVLMNN